LPLDARDAPYEQQRAAREGACALLASYLGIEPRDVEIARGIRGRPELAGAHDLGFNLSHTAGLALLAFGRGRAIGVDVEALDRRAPSRGLIECALNPREASRVARSRPEERVGAFLGYWTVKEAYAKALGAGLALDLRAVGVEGRLDRPRLDLPAGSERWQVRRPALPSGFVGAVVADGRPWGMRVRELSCAAQLS
jgi:4'-phosphopantetheinyl transferase